MAEGLKYDNEKTAHDLVPPFAQEQYAKVLTFGAGKYSAHNWENGINWSRIIGAIKRHTLAIERGDDYDPETGLLHSAHLMCEAGFLTEFYKIFPHGDDRLVKKIPRIGLDIDDVLADFVGAYCGKYKMERPTAWSFDRKFNARYEELKKDDSFWLKIKPIIDANTIPFEPACYITSRECKKEITEKWLDDNNFPRAPVFYVGVGGSKVEIAKKNNLDIFVDDCYKNFEEMNRAGVFTYLFDATHNQRYSVGHKRIKSLNEIINKL